MLQKYFSHTEFQKFYDCENIEAAILQPLDGKQFCQQNKLSLSLTSCMKREEDLMIR